jgi:uncharacterized iron-regulated membrane protein
MKKIFALLVVMGAGVGAFLWWKRQQVIAANEVSADPWPAAVAPVQPAKSDFPDELAAPVVNPTDSIVNPKKLTPKKKAVKKATQLPE